MSLEVEHSKLLVRQLIDRDTFTYTYLLVDPDTREGVLIDPVLEQADRDLKLIQELGVELLYVLESHVHADHVTSAGVIRQTTGAKIVYSEAAGVQSIDVEVNDGDTLNFGSYEIKVIATPGHTSGCVSYYVDGMVFTGDALMIRGCGRTDFQQGDASALYDSVVGKLFALGNGVVVYPAHDYQGRTASTIGEEKRWNARLGGGRHKEQFIEIMKNLNLDLPKRINEAVPANMECGISLNPSQYLHEDFSMDDLYKAWESLAKNQLIVDTRSPEEYRKGHVPGSRNIPFGTEAALVDQLQRYDKVYLYCRSGRRAQTALTHLTIRGLRNIVCVGHSGMPDWERKGYAVET